MSDRGGVLEIVRHGWLAIVALATHAAVGVIALTLPYLLERYVHWLYDGHEPRVFGLFSLGQILQGGDAVLIVIIVISGTLSAFRTLGRH